MIIHPSGLKALHSPLQNVLVQCILQGSPQPIHPHVVFLAPSKPLIAIYLLLTPINTQFLALFNA